VSKEESGGWEKMDHKDIIDQEEGGHEKERRENAKAQIGAWHTHIIVPVPDILLFLPFFLFFSTAHVPRKG